jgi:hypothetical protein
LGGAGEAPYRRLTRRLPAVHVKAVFLLPFSNYDYFPLFFIILPLIAYRARFTSLGFRQEFGHT